MTPCARAAAWGRVSGEAGNKKPSECAVDVFGFHWEALKPLEGNSRKHRPPLLPREMDAWTALGELLKERCLLKSGGQEAFVLLVRMLRQCASVCSHFTVSAQSFSLGHPNPELKGTFWHG